MMKRLFSVVALLVIASMLLAACGGGASQSAGTIKVSYPEPALG